MKNRKKSKIKFYRFKLLNKTMLNAENIVLCLQFRAYTGTDLKKIVQDVH